MSAFCVLSDNYDCSFPDSKISSGAISVHKSAKKVLNTKKKTIDAQIKSLNTIKRDVKKLQNLNGAQAPARAKTHTLAIAWAGISSVAAESCVPVRSNARVCTSAPGTVQSTGVSSSSLIHPPAAPTAARATDLNAAKATPQEESEDTEESESEAEKSQSV